MPIGDVVDGLLGEDLFRRGMPIAARSRLARGGRANGSPRRRRRCRWRGVAWSSGPPTGPGDRRRSTLRTRYERAPTRPSEAGASRASGSSSATRETAGQRADFGASLTVIRPRRRVRYGGRARTPRARPPASPCGFRAAPIGGRLATARRRPPGSEASEEAPATTPRTSRSSRASSRSASGPACTSAPPASAACTTSSTRSSTTRSTRRWPGYCDRIDVTLARRRRRSVVDNGRGIPVEPIPGCQGPPLGARGRADRAARRRQVRRRRLQDLRRPARRRRLGRQRAVGAARPRGRPRRRASTRWRSPARQGHEEAHEGQGGAARPARSSRSGPTPRSSPRRSSSGSEILPSACRDGVPEQGPRDPARRRARDRTKEVFKDNGGIVDFVKYLNQARSRCSRGSSRSRTRATTARSRSRCSGTPATTRASTRSRTASPPPRAACTRRASRRRSPTWSTATRARKGLLKEKDDNLLGEDIREGLTAIISVKLRDPQFEGQTKAKLGNAAMRSLVEKAVEREARRVARGAPDRGQARSSRRRQAAAKARMAAQQARDLTRRKSLLEGAVMPGKLADCSVARPRRVRAVHRRGRLAPAVSAKSARDPRDPGDPADPRQDPERRAGPARQDAQNHEIQALITAIGAGVGEEFDLDEGSATTRSC